MSIHPAPPRRRIVRALAAVLLMLGSGPAAAQEDDTALFSTAQVAPNVLLLMDNSASMNHLIWHPAFDPAGSHSCNNWNPDVFFTADPNGGDITLTRCGNTRTIPVDKKADDLMRVQGSYLNWLFSDESAPYQSAIVNETGNGFTPNCVENGNTFRRFGRTRMNVAKQALQNVVCQVNLVGEVRFGISVFRGALVNNQPVNEDLDPNGGYVLAEVELPESEVQADLIRTVNAIEADSQTPISEALFQSYTYFMSRNVSDIPVGRDGSTRFPRYEYKTTTTDGGGSHTTKSSSWPVDPMEYSCQKSFVIIITDGEPTKDDFDIESPSSTARGFGDFQALIGDYHTGDGEDERGCSGSDCSLYLDDIAKYMQDNDFRPDMEGDQVIDTYTIAFSLDPTAQDLLQKTADVGNGLFFATGDEEALADAIVDSLTDIIEKSQSFTAATVPASRTAAGDHLYVSLFTPSNKTQYWSGHLRSYAITAAGEIHDRFGQCALLDPNAPAECFSGPFQSAELRPPFWDAADEVPSPSSRRLMTSLFEQPGQPNRTVRFRDESQGGLLAPGNMGVFPFPPTSPYTGSQATSAEELTAEIVANVRGCKFGTGANGVACQERPTLLSDIFHSNPVVVGQPALFDSDPSYKEFARQNATRDRVIYAGNNGGFLAGYLAGRWRTTPAPAGYDDGTGEELFGFMPWPSRQTIRELPRDAGGRDFYFVDGSPTVSDVWSYPSATTVGKNPDGSEWSTLLVGGLRQGGEAYYALDVTDPSLCASSASSDGGWPCYAWEFPMEADPRAFADTSLWSDYVGETWGDPIITKIRVKVGAATNNGQGFERWVAIVTGGYHPTSNPNEHQAYDPAGTKGRSIWILDAKTGEPLAVQRFRGSGARCDTAGEPSYNPATPRESMCYAFASTPAVFDVDGDGFADTIVVGDLGGQVWKWVIRGLGEDAANTGASIEVQPNWSFRKIFQAPVHVDGGGNNGIPFYKSFFFPPAATLKNNKVWIAMGTGERTQLSFMGDSSTTADNNRFYVFVEPDIFDRQKTLADLQADPSRGVLRESTDFVELLTNQSSANLGGAKGFFIVGAEGEKWVTNVDIFGFVVLVSSYIPPSTTVDPCTIGGSAFLYAFEITSGQGFFTTASGGTERVKSIGGGLPTDPRVTLGTGDPKSNRVIISKQGGEIENLQAPPGFGPGIGVFYWRELQ